LPGSSRRFDQKHRGYPLPRHGKRLKRPQELAGQCLDVPEQSFVEPHEREINSNEGCGKGQSGIAEASSDRAENLLRLGALANSCMDTGFQPLEAKDIEAI